MTDHLAPSDRPGHAPRQRLWKVRAKQVVLATGMIERPMVFAENDRPGILMAGAARTYLNRYGVLPGRTAAVVTNNDGAWRTALELAAAGVAIAGIVDVRPNPTGALVEAARRQGIDVFAGHGVVGTEGRDRVHTVRIRPLTEAGDAVHGPETMLSVDTALVSGGWNPAVHLFSQSRGKLAWDPANATFVPGPSFQAERSAGGCNGARLLADALAEGFAAGAAASTDAGFAATAPDAPQVDEPSVGPQRNLWLLPPDRPLGKVKAFVDFQNDVTAKDLKLALREGYRSVEHVKRYTTTGMGTDQGKLGNVNALGIVADALGAAVPQVGVTTFRPPYTPVTFGVIAGRKTRGLFDPVRTTPLHPWHVEKGAQFENVGQWKRAWYYPRPGETLDQAVARECEAARTTCGVLDATTLGKIDVQGRDAAGVPQPHLHQRLVEAGRRPLPLRPDAGRGRHGDGRRRHRPDRREPLPHDHHHRRRRQGDAVAGGMAADRMAGAAGPPDLGHRAMGGDVGLRAEQPPAAGPPDRRHRPVAGGVPVHGLAPGHRRRRAGAGVPDQLHRGTELRDQRPRQLWPRRDAGGREGGRGPGPHPLRHRGHACPARREGLDHRRTGHRRHGHAA